jgi:hypothetical protein
MYVWELIAYLSSTLIISHVTWKGVFYFNAIVGFLWIALWLAFGSDHPPTAEASLPVRTERSKVPIGALLSTPAVLALPIYSGRMD